MNKRDLFLRHTQLNQLLAKFAVGREFPIGAGRRQIAKNDLSCPAFCVVNPQPMHVACTGIDLPAFVGRSRKPHQSHIQSSLAAIPSHLEHVVSGGLNSTTADLPRALNQALHEIPKFCRWLHRYRLPYGLRHWQIQHLGCANVRNQAEHAHQFRYVEESAETRLHAIATTVRSKLQGSHCLTKVGCPCVEVLYAELFEHVCLKEAHHRPNLGHRVADRGRGGQYQALAISTRALHVLSFDEDIKRAL